MDKIIYSILKELDNNEDRLIKGEEIILPRANDYNISNEVYGKIIKKLEDEELITASYSRAKGLPSLIFSMDITNDGKKYLKENSVLGKLYRGLKEIKSFL